MREVLRIGGGRPLRNTHTNQGRIDMIKTVSTLTAAAVLLVFTSVFAQTPPPAPEPAPAPAVTAPAPAAEAPNAGEKKDKKGKAKGKHGKAKAKAKE